MGSIAIIFSIAYLLSGASGPAYARIQVLPVLCVTAVADRVPRLEFIMHGRAAILNTVHAHLRCICITNATA
jgi:hypothetical protein